MNKSSSQSYDKPSFSDKNQLPLWIKRTICLWTAMEINLAMFTVYKWQSIKLLWINKYKFWDFSILTMTYKMCRGTQCFCLVATTNNQNFQACHQALSGKVLRSFKIFSCYFTLLSVLLRFLRETPGFKNHILRGHVARCSHELTHFKKMVQVWKNKSLLFCLRYMTH